MAVAADFVQCSLCSFRTPTLSAWISHLRLVHSQDEEFVVTCGINGCTGNYRKCSSFLSHVYRHHRTVITNSSPIVHHPLTQEMDFENAGSAPVDNSCDPSVVDGDSHSSSLLNHTLHQILGIDKIEQQKRSALFILHLKEVKGLSETAIQTVVSGFEDMLQYTVRRIEAGVYERLSQNAILPQDLELNEFFENVADPFEGLKTVHMQEKFYSKHFGCIVS